MTRIFCILFLVLCFICFSDSGLVLAGKGKKEIFASYEYVMGDNDTRVQAREICYLEARRRLLDQAGIYIESATEVKDSVVTADAVTSFAAAVLNIEVVQEQYLSRGGSFVVVLKLKADIDPEEMERRLAVFLKDREKLNSFQKQSSEAKELEARILALEESIKSSKGREFESVRNEQQSQLRKLSEVHAARKKLIAEVELSTDSVKEVVEPGMTGQELESLLGKPRISKKSATHECLRYGKYWVVLRADQTICVRSRLSFSRRYNSDCHCSGLASDFILR